ncbi:MAG: AAA family ATPase [Alphaproteobacteria bacterium]|nr:AAA family ATPase [Alphaproteobacteria bacterium]
MTQSAEKSAEQTIITRNDAIIDAVKKQMAAEKTSQADLARVLGVSTTLINQVLKGIYKGDLGSILLKLEQWSADRRDAAEARAQAVTAPDFMETPTAVEFMTALSVSQQLKKYIIITGAPGVGKTMAAREYFRRHSAVTMVTLSPVVSRPLSLLQHLSDELNISTRVQSRMTRNLIDYWNARPGGMLIVDEAQHLSTQALDELRSIHDQSAVGIALLGNENLIERLTGDNTAVEFGQLRSRFSIRVRRRTPMPQDIEMMLNAWAISSKEMRVFLVKVASKLGHLRTLNNVLEMAVALAQGKQAALELKHLKQAYVYQSGHQLEGA